MANLSRPDQIPLVPCSSPGRSRASSDQPPGLDRSCTRPAFRIRRDPGAASEGRRPTSPGPVHDPPGQWSRRGRRATQRPVCRGRAGRRSPVRGPDRPAARSARSPGRGRRDWSPVDPVANHLPPEPPSPPGCGGAPSASAAGQRHRAPPLAPRQCRGAAAPAHPSSSRACRGRTVLPSS